jgi:mono/diheme cytochrome c family protein
MHKHIFGLISVMGVLALAAACGSSSKAPEQGAGVVTTDSSQATFAAVQAGVLQSSCVTCHSAARSSGGINLQSYETVMGAAAAHGHAIVVAGNPDGSHLYEVMQSGEMPPNGPKMSDSQLKLVRSWIQNGAKND